MAFAPANFSFFCIFFAEKVRDAPNGDGLVRDEIASITVYLVFNQCDTQDSERVMVAFRNCCRILNLLDKIRLVIFKETGYSFFIILQWFISYWRMNFIHWRINSRFCSINNAFD
eukprot:TRINITY_DN14717_c0_g2_i1.p1 TRINITY_DN14717_c0_g2~~TRINITY_DN14717_c0_g2_i1.p1  ORF type:complete len:115 (+),score=3.39 TRINITY_DN14717_c0_g2_i1:165-509(+)